MDNALLIIETRSTSNYDLGMMRIRAEYLVKYPTGHIDWVTKEYYDAYMSVINLKANEESPGMKLARLY